MITAAPPRPPPPNARPPGPIRRPRTSVTWSGSRRAPRRKRTMLLYLPSRAQKRGLGTLSAQMPAQRALCELDHPDPCQQAVDDRREGEPEDGEKGQAVILVRDERLDRGTCGVAEGERRCGVEHRLRHLLRRELREPHVDPERDRARAKPDQTGDDASVHSRSLASIPASSAESPPL